MATSADCILTEVVYLNRDSKHDDEKPYELRYDAEGDIPRTNMVNTSRPVTVVDFRALQNSRNFEDYGFSAAKILCGLTAAEFSNTRLVEEVYYPTIQKYLRQIYPNAAKIKVLEHDVSLYYTAVREILTKLQDSQTACGFPGTDKTNR